MYNVLYNFTASQSDSEDSENLNQVDINRKLTTQKLSEAFALIQSAKDIFSENDPFEERSVQVNRKLEMALTSYTELFKTKREQSKQTSLVSYFSKSDNAQNLVSRTSSEMQVFNKEARPKQKSFIDFYFKKTSNVENENIDHDTIVHSLCSSDDDNDDNLPMQFQLSNNNHNLTLNNDKSKCMYII